MTTKIIEDIILYKYELSDEENNTITEIILPNCYEIIDSFNNENHMVQKIIAPKLNVIHSFNTFNFTSLKNIIVPNIKYIYAGKFTIYDINIETTSYFNSVYPLKIENPYRIDCETITSDIVFNKDILSTFKIETNKFKNCKIYGICKERKIYYQMKKLKIYYYNIQNINR